jgi:hypothetical protein
MYVFKSKTVLAAYAKSKKHLPPGTVAEVSATGTLRFVGSTA